jgi:TRAP-type mannitol/chloroaromatic compound transport system permease small subunit
MERPEEHLKASTLTEAHGGGPLVLPRNRFSNGIDGVVIRAGDAASWLWPLLVLVVVVNVFARYGLGMGSIMMEEIQWHIYAVGFLIGLSYCADIDRHVRVDVLAEHWPLRRRAWIELGGLLFFMLPFVLVIAIWSVPYVVSSWDFKEVSTAPGGLPYRWVLKSFMVIGMALLALTAISRITRCTTLLFNCPRPLADDRR